MWSHAANGRGGGFVGLSCVVWVCVGVSVVWVSVVWVVVCCVGCCPACPCPGAVLWCRSETVLLSVCQ